MTPYRIQVPGFPSYFVTSDGVVISVKSGTERALKLARNSSGYYQGTLCAEDGRRKQFRIHQLVAQLFIGNPHNLPCVRHLDGNKSNNCALNLAWGTYQENEDDKRLHGTWDARRTGKLSPEDRRKIRELAAAGSLHREIADEVGVSRPTVTRAINRTTWDCDQ